MTELPPEDPDVIAARRGDRAALDRLFARMQKRLMAAASAQLSPGLRRHVRTSDIFQSTCMEAIRNISTFDGADEESLASWMLRIMSNVLKDRWRYINAGKRRRAPGSSNPDAAAEAADYRMMSPSSAAIWSELLERYDAAVKVLSDEQRVVLHARLKEGRAHRDIAERLGKSEEAVRNLYRRARVSLILEINRLFGDDVATRIGELE